MPPPAEGGMQLSEDLADLLQKKIREFEKSSAEETERSQKAQKGRARAAAKTKLKEAKQLVNDADSSAAEKASRLWASLRTEHELAEKGRAEAEAKLREIAATEKEKNSVQAELNKTLAVKNKLEVLCRQLQGQTNALIEERRKVTDAARQKRQDLADEFQTTIGDVKKKMDQQACERARLARENEDLRSRFKQFFEQYDRREKELQDQQKSRDSEVQVFEAKLTEQATVFQTEATREAQAQREYEELSSTEEVLRGQLKTYTDKFSHFQDALSKSDKVLGQYKRQRNKMQRRVEVLEKENTELRGKGERKIVQTTKERDALVKDKDGLQARCKALQAERQQLLEEVEAAEKSKPELSSPGG